jgi:hypothetical protein
MVHQVPGKGDVYKSEVSGTPFTAPRGLRKKAQLPETLVWYTSPDRLGEFASSSRTGSA